MRIDIKGLCSVSKISDTLKIVRVDKGLFNAGLNFLIKYESLSIQDTRTSFKLSKMKILYVICFASRVILNAILINLQPLNSSPLNQNR
ncbi:hypothetical protein BpHYR1_010610 [Brachionus plicatilis]|uniref:Uncharacterized protein n=1 Tax=Brachionus plicatilis TaxID=10195 RepID=A0A3M7S6I5_BRAPC|nr:hypothetical protein BpHYR1_010610 [Brachionus plicatilis]